MRAFIPHWSSWWRRGAWAATAAFPALTSRNPGRLRWGARATPAVALGIEGLRAAAATVRAAVAVVRIEKMKCGWCDGFETQNMKRKRLLPIFVSEVTSATNIRGWSKSTRAPYIFVGVKTKLMNIIHICWFQVSTNKFWNKFIANVPLIPVV
jgi:hypothetical protein